MATISNTPRPGYVWDSTDNVWYPIGVGNHNHSEIQKTLIDAKGDLVVGTANDTVARQAVGTDGQVLMADSTQTNGIKWGLALPDQTSQSGKYLTTNGTAASWGTIATGSMTLLSTTTLSGATTTISGFSSSYKNLLIEITGMTCGTSGYIRIAPNNNTGSANQSGGKYNALAVSNNSGYILPSTTLANAANSSENKSTIIIYDYAKATEYINYDIRSVQFDGTVYTSNIVGGGLILNNVTSLVFNHSSGSNFTGGTVRLYGVN